MFFSFMENFKSNIANCHKALIIVRADYFSKAAANEINL